MTLMEQLRHALINLEDAIEDQALSKARLDDAREKYDSVVSQFSNIEFNVPAVGAFNGKIQLIKEIRSMGIEVGLVQAKDAVERWQMSMNPPKSE